MKKKRLLLVFFATLLCCGSLLAQVRRTITGTVTDADGKPVPGATVTVKGTARAVVANENGMYSIEVQGNPELVVSSVGFVSKTLRVGADNDLPITLISQANDMADVVITTALGIKREARSLGYSAQTVKGSDLTIAQAPTIAQGLMGKVAGLQISQSGGGADGASSRIVIRGNTMLTGDNRAMIIVDGVPINNDPVNVNSNNGGNGKSVLGGANADVSGNNDWGTGMNMINQEDIEDITVLKGPEAAALYGTRGANGVILITRKKGGNKPGLGVDYSFSYRTTDPYELLDYQNEYGQGGVASMTTADQSKWFPLNSNGQRMQVGNGTNAAGDYLKNSFGALPYTNAFDFYTYFSYPGSYSWGAKMDGQPIMNYDGVLRPYSAQPDNWKAFFPKGSVAQHNVAVSGGNDKATFRVSYTRNNTKPNMINSKMYSNTFNLGSTFKVSERVRGEVTSSYVNFYRLNAPQIGNAWQAAPTYSMARDFDPQLAFSQQFGPNGERIDVTNGGGKYPSSNVPAYPYNTGYLNNQYWNLLKNNNDFTRNQFLGSLKLMADLTSFLNITAQGGVDNSNDVSTFISYPTDVLGRAGGAYKETMAKNFTRDLTAYMRLHKEGFIHPDFNASLTMGGQTFYRSDYSVGNSTNGDFVKPFIFALNNGGGNPASAVPDEVKYAKKINSVYSLLNFSYKNLLFLEATGRNDWSSTLPLQYNSYFYPTVNMSYVFTDGFKRLKASLPWLSFGKLKVSYAETGSDTDPYSIYNLLESNTYNGVLASSLPSNVKSLDIKPARNKSFQVGLNLAFLQNRITLDVTSYWSKSFNQILNNPLPVSSGYSAITINTGSLGNNGIEVILNATPVKTNNFSWNIGINAANGRTKVLALQEGINELQLGSYFGTAGVFEKVKVGEYYGTIYGKDYRYHNGEKIVKRATGPNGSPATFTVNGKTYYAGTLWELTSDVVPIGNSQPLVTGGITNTFRYKNFSLYVLTDAKIGGDTYFGSYEAGMGSGTLKGTLKERNGGGLPLVYPDGSTANTGVNFGGVFATYDVQGNVVSTTPNTDVVHYLWYYAGTYSAWNHIGIPRSEGVFKNSWMKLRELSLSYQVPSHIIKSTKVLQNLNLSVYGRDLFYIFTTIPKGLNPEGVNGIGNIQGIEYSSMPKTRSFGFTIRTAF
ncbi:SusC/RagA family TonB-linked outer membrane protein [Niabella pedocola]|uniref:SusC/RagA family TonB-linked outer membrane protein n=1 Tax=Niabella pedocola TaxID=1752077 RepID=A0ABS8PUI5_9BACT|nr:SusC/RagA family TonB-linked outer membrane protein [Niabella pedocola]MCD2423947.1 SusC/RagA family TonB-linked outer membrane protein [Niabella pedocola]